MTVYPTLSDVVVIHAKLIAKFGGCPGMRDQAALKSALARPQTGYYTDLIQEAAALWESLSQNHPFIDGNKRIAVTVTAAFLRLNGFRLQFDDAEAFAFLNELYENRRMRFAELEAWLREHTQPAGRIM